MVCGASGIGKTSFISLFMKKLNLKEGELEESYVRDLNSYVIKKHTEGFDEAVMNSLCGFFKLRVLDSPGYGNKTDISEWRHTIIEEITGRMHLHRSLCKAVEIQHEDDAQTI